MTTAAHPPHCGPSSAAGPHLPRATGMLTTLACPSRGDKDRPCQSYFGIRQVLLLSVVEAENVLNPKLSSAVWSSISHVELPQEPCTTINTSGPLRKHH